jgi:DNA-binding NarL/FixJ family response regulator
VDHPVDSVTKLHDFMMRTTASRDPGVALEALTLLRSTDWAALELVVRSRSQRAAQGEIFHIVSTCASISMHRLLEARQADAVLARQMAMYALRCQGLSFPRIATLVRRDHSTVMHGVRRIRSRLVAREPAATALFNRVLQLVPSMKIGAPDSRLDRPVELFAGPVEQQPVA